MVGGLALLLLVMGSCGREGRKGLMKGSVNEVEIVSEDGFGGRSYNGIDSALKVGEYVRAVFEDRDANLWFGTLVRGAGRYDGDSLVYFTEADGLAGSQVNGIAEDLNGNLWFATNGGVSRYDGEVFQNFGLEEGLNRVDTWCVRVDSRGVVWVGTVGGAFRYDGERFEAFELPASRVVDPTYKISKDLVWCIFEDQKGGLWFGTDGSGAYRYDGEGFVHFTREDGLCSNDVRSIVEDGGGDMWFASIQTRVPEADNPYSFVDSKDGGLSRYDGKDFVQFADVEGLSGVDVGPLYRDGSGTLWIASVHYGVFRYDGTGFSLFSEDGGLTINCIQSMCEGRDGRFWFGFSGGLFRYDGIRFVHVGRDGPWE